jgi:two-component system, chemotaxis family, protein-glutamate methylesterase/glutaminase
VTAPDRPVSIHRDVIVVGASAGGIDSLCRFVHALPTDLPAAVIIVMHLPPTGASVLADILRRSSKLPVEFAQQDQDLTYGTILVAPSDHHVVVLDSSLRTTRGPRENGYRPAIDVLFRSAARASGPRVVAVVLSGDLDDGTAGALAVQQRGGVVLVQDPSDATHSSMPQSAIANVKVDRIAAASELGVLVGQLTRTALEAVEPPRPGPTLDLEVALARLDRQSIDSDQRPGAAAAFGCPECHGALFEIDDGGLLRFRCRVGHAWSTSALLVHQTQALESALWMALRGLEEKATLSRQMAARAGLRGSRISARRFSEQAGSATQSADLIRTMLEMPITALPELDPS